MLTIGISSTLFQVFVLPRIYKQNLHTFSLLEFLYSRALYSICLFLSVKYFLHLFHLWVLLFLKGVVHFKKTTFVDNLLAPMSSKMSTSFFLQSKRN